MTTAQTKIKPIPNGYRTVSTYLVAEDANKLIEFLTAAFDAKENYRHPQPDGKIGDSMLLISDPSEAFKAMPTMIYLYVDDADVTYERALAAGATSVMPPADHFYGDRSGGVKDFCSNFWWIATHIEDVSFEEVIRRGEALKTQKAA